ncbi:MAG: HAMP domain-containing histidine kinase [Nitrospiraceae bacterium]|nr:HAMP domain-containing histidine kinase [Nitrospiraceae bacterium]
MKLTIFTRLVIGFLIILAMVMAVSVSMLVELGRFNNITRSIMNVDNHLLENEKKMSDALLSQILYEKKYLIIHDDALYDKFLLAKLDFMKALQASIFIAADDEKKKMLTTVHSSFKHYQSLFDEEVDLVRAGKSYPVEEHTQQKEKAVNSILDELKNIKASSQKHTFEQIRQLEGAMADARQTAGLFVAAALLLGVLISLVITRSITKPLSRVITKTRDVSNGILKGDLKVASPPELGDLSKAFNMMCEKLNALEHMKSDFYALMSHELRTPLTSIREGTSLLLEGAGGQTNASQTKLLRIIAEESNRLINLVNSLMDLSKMEAGMMTFDFSHQDITPLIKKAAIEIAPLAAAKHIIIETAPAENLPYVKMDSEKIMQALRNLIGNAVKFTSEGGRIRITASNGNSAVKVAVADTGPGIPSENLAMIFEKFHQAQYHRQHNIKGTGLGLAIAKQIVTAHGGTIWAESVIGQGSSFIFSLPV